MMANLHREISCLDPSLPLHVLFYFFHWNFVVKSSAKDTVFLCFIFILMLISSMTHEFIALVALLESILCSLGFTHSRNLEWVDLIISFILPFWLCSGNEEWSS